MPLSSQPIVRGFLGENRLAPDDLLPDNVSPDAQNVDYSSGTIKKRKGFTKIHERAIYSGGVHIDNDNNNRCIVIPDAPQMDLVGDFTIEVFFYTVKPLITTETILSKIDATSGWIFTTVGTADIRFRKYDSGGTLRQVLITDSDFIPLETGMGYHLTASRAGTTLQLRMTRRRDGLATNPGGVACSGDLNTTRDVYYGAGSGATPVNGDINFVVDELRIWDVERTDAELADTGWRELNEEEVLSSNLVGYWKMNEGSGNIVEDSSVNRNHGSLFGSGATPTTVEGLIPEGGEDDFAVRYNGQDQRATLAYRSDFAPIQNTGNVWTVEAWLRLDSAPADIANSRFLALGDFDPDGTNTGCVFSLYVDANLNLFYSFSTTTTHSNVTQDTTYDVILGQAFHVLLLRDGVDSILTYINGVQLHTLTSVGAENGPTVDADTGLTIAHMLTAGVVGNFCPCTIDEVRLWTMAQGGRYPGRYFDYGGNIPEWLAGPLVSQLHFNAGGIVDDEVDVDAAVTFLPGENKPTWTLGTVYPLNPEPLALAAPLTRHVGGEDVSSGQARVHHEILVATRTDFWALQGTKRRFLSELITPNAFNNRYTHALYRNLLIVANGLGRNYRYDGKASPVSLTLPTWTDNVIVAATGSGSGWNGVEGDYKYRFAWYDNFNLIEGLFGGEETEAMLATHDTAEISGMAALLDGYPNVTHVRIYRQNPGSTVFRWLVDVVVGTTTYSDDAFDDLQGNDAANTRRGHPAPHRICAVYSNRLFLGNESDNPSSSKYSDPNTENFPGTNEFKVDENDGDELTGYASMFGGLVIFKQNSIHFLTGSGPTTFRLIKVLDGIGCVSHNTIAPSPGGLYFLAEDGVYLFDGRSARYLSHSQQPEFQKLDRLLARNAVGVYDISTHQYIVSFDQGGNGLGDIVEESPSLLSARWPMNTDGVADVGSRDFTTAVGTVLFTEDQTRGQVAYFNGGARMEAALVFLNNPFVALWFRGHPDLAGVDGIISSGTTSGGFSLTATKSGGQLEVTAEVYDGGGLQQSVTAFASYDDWHHIAFGHDGTTLALWIDGEMQVSKPQGAITWDATPIWRLGADITVLLHLNGFIQNVLYIGSKTTFPADSLVRRIFAVESSQGEGQRPTFAFDEETQSWAKWDKGFDTLVLAEHTSRQNDVLAGRNGFVNKLLDGDRDGAGFILGGPRGDSGALTSESGPTIEDTSNLFPTEDDGLAGVEFTAVPSDTTEATQKRIILYNTTTKLHLDRSLDPAVTGIYYIGPIDLYWESRWMDMGDPAVIKLLQKLRLWAAENSATVTFKHKTNDAETWTTTTFSTVDEFIEILYESNYRGRKIKLRFEHITTDETVELQSWQNISEVLPLS